MAFDFPASPTVGQTYKPVGGPSFKWSGVSWTAEMAGVPVSVYVADSAPPNPAVGQLWWDSDSGNLFIWFADPDSTQWVQVSGMPAVEPPTALSNKNYVVNGGAIISQQNARNSSSTNGVYIADQWQVVYGGAALMTMASEADADVGFRLRQFAGGTFSPAAGDYGMLLQPFEGRVLNDFRWGTPSAKRAVLRFRARITVGPSLVMGVSLRGVSGSHVSFVCNVTVTTEWQEFVVPIPACTIGTWPNDTAVAAQLAFTSYAGTTYQTPIQNTWTAVGSYLAATGVGNLFSVAGRGLDIGEVGLYLDPRGTTRAPPWQAPDVSTDLLRCQQYWITLWAIQLGQADANVQAQLSIAPMRTNPAISSTGVTASWAASWVNSAGIVTIRQGGAGPFGGTQIVLNARM